MQKPHELRLFLQDCSEIMRLDVHFAVLLHAFHKSPAISHSANGKDCRQQIVTVVGC